MVFGWCMSVGGDPLPLSDDDDLPPVRKLVVERGRVITAPATPKRTSVRIPRWPISRYSSAYKDRRLLNNDMVESVFDEKDEVDYLNIKAIDLDSLDSTPSLLEMDTPVSPDYEIPKSTEKALIITNPRRASRLAIKDQYWSQSDSTLFGKPDPRPHSSSPPETHLQPQLHRRNRSLSPSAAATMVKDVLVNNELSRSVSQFLSSVPASGPKTKRFNQESYVETPNHSVSAAVTTTITAAPLQSTSHTLRKRRAARRSMHGEPINKAKIRRSVSRRGSRSASRSTSRSGSNSSRVHSKERLLQSNDVEASHPTEVGRRKPPARAVSPPIVQPPERIPRGDSLVYLQSHHRLENASIHRASSKSTAKSHKHTRSHSQALALTLPTERSGSRGPPTPPKEIPSVSVARSTSTSTPPVGKRPHGSSGTTVSTTSRTRPLPRSSSVALKSSATTGVGQVGVAVVVGLGRRGSGREVGIANRRESHDGRGSSRVSSRISGDLERGGLSPAFSHSQRLMVERPAMLAWDKALPPSPRLVAVGA